jgi:TRAP transporter TAXI family solute receptor
MAGIAAAQTIGFGSSGPGSITYSISSALAKIITEQVGVQVRVQPRGGNTVVLPAVNAGEVDFGVGNTNEIAEALSGVGMYEGQKLADLRVVTVLMPTPVALFVRKDSPIKSIKDLKGKRVPGTFTAQKIVQNLVAANLANAGLSWNDVKMVPVPNVLRNADDFIQGRLDTFFFALGTGKVLEADTAVGGIRALSIDPSPEAMARFREHVPQIYAHTVQPSENYPGIVEPTIVPTFDLLLFTNAKTPEELMYKVTKALHDGKASMLASFKTLGAGFSPEHMAKKLPAGEYHPGAVRFYREKGLWPPKQ